MSTLLKTAAMAALITGFVNQSSVEEEPLLFNIDEV